MQKMVTEIKAATQQESAGVKRNKYEYDSDEDVEEGTWEHKARSKEMTQTSGTHIHVYTPCSICCAKMWTSCVSYVCSGQTLYRAEFRSLSADTMLLYITYTYTFTCTLCMVFMYCTWC